MQPGPASPEATAERPTSSFLPHVLLATGAVAVAPLAGVWALRDEGIVTAYLPGMAIGVALSLLAAQIGRSYWATRGGSRYILFNELLLWGWLHRLLSERRLRSASTVLGRVSDAQRRRTDGLSRERQVRLLRELAKRLDARDPHTLGHSRRVARHSWMIASRLGLSREQVARVRAAAAMHDVGKIETPIAILRKPGRLTDEEFEIIKRHPVDGAEMVTSLRDDELTAFVRHHHERLDGTGYPDGLAGGEIPIGARIIAVADTFDAITSHRPYRASRSHKEALDLLNAEAGRQLDPVVVRAFVSHYSGRRGLALWAWAGSLPERALSTLLGGVGSVASAAKVAAVTALLSGVAATGAVLAPAETAHARHGSVARQAHGAGIGAAPASAGRGAAHLAPGAATTRAVSAPGRRRAARKPGAPAAGAGAAGGQPVSGTSSQAPGAGESKGSAQETPSGGHQPTRTEEQHEHEGGAETPRGGTPKGGEGTGGGKGSGGEGKGSEGKGSEGKGAEGKGSEGKGSEGKGSEGKGSEGKGTEGKGSEAKGSEAKGTETKGGGSHAAEAETPEHPGKG